MKKKRVLFDVDGFLLDFTTPALVVVEEVTGLPAPANAAEEWDLFRDYPEEVQAQFYNEFNKEGWCLGLKPYPGAVDGVHAVRSFADVFFVTSPMHGPHWAFERTRSLQYHFDATSKEVVHTSSKFLCVGDLFVDDKYDHVVEWSSYHPNGVALLWDQPYNRKYNYPLRVTSWMEILGAIKALSAG